MPNSSRKEGTPLLISSFARSLAVRNTESPKASLRVQVMPYPMGLESAKHGLDPLTTVCVLSSTLLHLAVLSGTSFFPSWLFSLYFSPPCSPITFLTFTGCWVRISLLDESGCRRERTTRVSIVEEKEAAAVSPAIEDAEVSAYDDGCAWVPPGLLFNLGWHPNRVCAGGRVDLEMTPADWADDDGGESSSDGGAGGDGHDRAWRTEAAEASVARVVQGSGEAGVGPADDCSELLSRFFDTPRLLALGDVFPVALII